MSEVLESVRSVQPDWCLRLAVQQQSVLLLAARGPDGIAKTHPCKEVQRAYRGTVLIAARFGRLLEWGERADTFMSLDVFADDARWEAAEDAFWQSVDDLPHHFLMHLLHGAEILGYKHPDERFRERWGWFYAHGVNSLHLNVESEIEMDARLCDWERESWDGGSPPDA